MFSPEKPFRYREAARMGHYWGERWAVMTRWKRQFYGIESLFVRGSKL